LKKINIDSIEPEMKIAEPIMVPFTEVTLVEAGAPLNEPTVLLLTSMGITEVTVYEEAELREMAARAAGIDPEEEKKTRKVLIVDDEREICNYISEVIASKGFKPKVSLNAADAWNALVSDPAINDIFLDIMMPEMNGIEFLNKIRKELGRNVNVVMVTAKKSIEDVVVAKKLGIVDYIMKPFTPDRILKPLQQTASANENGAAKPQTAVVPQQ
jgi:CheY-like chemotaxis protein